MSSLFGHNNRSTLAIFFVTTLGSSIASAAITARLATTVLFHSPLVGPALAASAVDILSIVNLIVATGLFLKRVSSGTTLVAWISGLVSCVVGNILTLVTLGRALRFSWDGRLDGNASSTYRIASIGLAFGAVGLVAEVVFYASIRPSYGSLPTERVQAAQARPSPTRSAKRRSITVHLSSLSSGAPELVHACPEPASPSVSAFSNSPRSSWRGSFNQAFRPMTSKTRLLLGTSLASGDSRSLYSGDPSAGEPVRYNDEDFAGWDTSAVEEGFEKPLGSKMRVTRLETIPGSRPVSPAHPLEGPFFGGTATDDAQRPGSAVDFSESCTSLSSASSSRRNAGLPATARTNSDVKFHIHPLFRSESPVPPPLASPKTVITASPYAGQIVSPELVLGPRLLTSPTGSRPATPNYAFLPARSRSGSIKSFRTNPGSPTCPTDVPERSFPQLSLAHPPLAHD